MCGIGVLIAPSTESQDDGNVFQEDLSLRRSWPSVLNNIQQRGPDSLNTVHHTFAVETQSWTLSLASSVLSLRGAGITQQPLMSSDGRLHLAWNGQIFDWNHTATSSKVRLDAGENDGVILLDRITSLLQGNRSCEEALNAALAEVEGPYAFALLDRNESKLFYGRDPLGRRSLLLHRSQTESSIAILSVASRELIDSAGDLTEVSCSSLWRIDMQCDPKTPLQVQRTPSRFNAPLLLRELRQPNHSDLEIEASPSPDQIRRDFLEVLSESVRKRVTNINTDQPSDEAHIAILFSGGLDCTTLALLADRHVPLGQPIDLLNVAFENIRSIEAAKNEKEKRRRAALKKQASTPASAGADITPADLEEEDTDVYAVPDRITGLASYSELCSLAPHRRWNFVSINIPYSTYASHRATVSALMSPTSSVMDLSIASALYFASRAQTQLYTSPARVLISGLGADELLGGYSRHRQAYSHKSLPGLVSELQLDLDRLPQRNLGRDDRILSTHGREARYPYLDRSVIEFLTSIPVQTKVDLHRIASEGAGGDKRLLRDLAKELGLVGASELKKRAMQFGTRSAKIDMDSGKVKGHHKLN